MAEPADDDIAAPAPSTREDPPSQLASIEEQLKKLAVSVGSLRTEQQQLRTETIARESHLLAALKSADSAPNRLTRRRASLPTTLRTPPSMRRGVFLGRDAAPMVERQASTDEESVHSEKLQLQTLDESFSISPPSRIEATPSADRSRVMSFKPDPIDFAQYRQLVMHSERQGSRRPSDASVNGSGHLLEAFRGRMYPPQANGAGEAVVGGGLAGAAATGGGGAPPTAVAMAMCGGCGGSPPKLSVEAARRDARRPSYASSVGSYASSVGHRSSISETSSTLFFHALTASHHASQVSSRGALWRRGMLHPLSRVRVAWDVLMLTLVMYTAFWAPLAFAFGYEYSHLGAHQRLELVMDLLFALDIVLNFRTGFCEPNGVEVLEWRPVAARYLRSWFTLDVLGAFPTTLIDVTAGGRGVHGGGAGVPGGAGGGPDGWLRLLRLLKLLRIGKLRQLQDRWLFRPALKATLNLLLFFLLVHHLIACVLWRVAVATNEQLALAWSAQASGATPFHTSLGDGGAGGVGGEVTAHEVVGDPDRLRIGWEPPIAFFDVDDGSFACGLWERYVWALHLASVISMGNDSCPETPGQMAVSVAGAFVGQIVTSVVIGSAASAIVSANRHQAKCRSAVANALEYMGHFDVPRDLQQRVVGYYNYLWHCRYASDDERLFNDLPTTLRTQLDVAVKRQLITQVAFLKPLELPCLAAVIQRLLPVVAMPGECVIKQGELGHEMLLIRSGQVQLVISRGGIEVELRRMRDVSYFGEEALLNPNARRSVSVVTLTFCDFQMLTRSAFNEINAVFPELREALAAHVEPGACSHAIPTSAALGGGGGGGGGGGASARGYRWGPRGSFGGGGGDDEGGEGGEGRDSRERRPSRVCKTVRRAKSGVLQIKQRRDERRSADRDFRAKVRGVGSILSERRHSALMRVASARPASATSSCCSSEDGGRQVVAGGGGGGGACGGKWHSSRRWSTQTRVAPLMPGVC